MFDPSGEGRHSEGELLAIERDRALWSQAAEQGMRETISSLSNENDKLRIRLARYDEAVLLLQLALAELYRPENQATFNRVDAFLAAELQEGDMETRPTGIPHYLRDSRLRSNGMREAAEIVRNFRPASACICGNYISFHNGIPTHQPGCLVGECLEIADEIDARADETDESLRE